MMFGKKYIPLMLAIPAAFMTGCSADGDYQGVEYAPQMAHSVAYEPLTQFSQDDITQWTIWDLKPNSSPLNDYGMNPDKAHSMNMMTPVKGTIARQYYKHNALKDTVLFYDNIHKDSAELAGRLIKSPLPVGDAKVVEEGKALYTSYCQPCHGEKGDGKGKVGEVYKGVPNYATGRYKTLPEGHIFHVITHGKARMWAHKSQLSPEERWKVVRYVQELQKGS